MIPSADFGRTGRRVSRLGFGAWAIGGSWGSSDDTTSLGALRRALELGVTFIDTADVYGDGHSETLVAGVRRPDIRVATKAGRRRPAQTVEGYSLETALTSITDGNCRREPIVRQILRTAAGPRGAKCHARLAHAPRPPRNDGPRGAVSVARLRPASLACWLLGMSSNVPADRVGTNRRLGPAG
jgi:hypothetical protein